MTIARTCLGLAARTAWRNGPYLLAALSIVLIVFGVTGCGGQQEEPRRALTPPAVLDLTNPRAVARAYAASKFRCGPQGAGVRYDLSLTTSPAGRWPREQYIRNEQRRGCTPKPIPPLRVALSRQQGDYALVDVYAGPSSGHLQLMRVEGGVWRVDTYHSDLAGLDTTSTPSTSAAS